MRQQELAQRIGHLLGRKLVAPSGGQDGIEHQRHVGIVGDDFRDGRNDLDAPEHADLECSDRNVLEKATGLVRHPLGIEGSRTRASRWTWPLFMPPLVPITSPTLTC